MGPRLNPTPDQQAVLDHQGDALVQAPPGSGKTTVALLKARSEIARLGPYQKILFLTFSNAAVDTITSRRTQLVGGVARGKVQVTNFHQFALEILRSYGAAVGLGSPIKIVDDVTGRFLERRSFGNPRKMGYLPFGEFIPLAVEVLGRNRSLQKAVASCYPVVLVDEFQDTDSHQWELVKLVADGATVIALGDPDQMIYRFQGASPERFPEFLAWRRGAKQFELDPQRNPHRFETPKILEVARCLRRLHEGATLPGWVNDRAQPVHLARYYNKGQCKAAVASFILNSRQKACKTIAILTYKNDTAKQISNWLNDGSLGGKLSGPFPHYFHIAERRLETLLVICRACALTSEAAFAGNERLFGEALQWWAFLPTSLSSRASKAREQAENHLWNLGEQLLCGEQPSEQCCRVTWGILRETVAEELRPTLAIEKVWATMQGFRPLRKYINEAVRELEPHISRTLAKMVAAADASPRKRLREVAEDIVTQIHTERSQGRPRSLTVMTIHQAKGREYDAVAVVYPAYSRESKDPEDRARIMYTAASRARKRLLLLVQYPPKQQ